MSILVTPNGTYVCDLCGEHTEYPQRCHRAVTDEAGKVVAGTDNTYCPACRCTAPLEPDLHEHFAYDAHCPNTQRHLRLVADERPAGRGGGRHRDGASKTTPRPSPSPVRTAANFPSRSYLEDSLNGTTANRDRP